MPGILLDTHVLYWMVSREKELSEEVYVIVGRNLAAGNLFVSPISAWELALAVGKSRLARRPNLGSKSPGRWFRDAVGDVGARIVPIHQRIALEAASVATATGHKDPGDCFLIATDRVRRLSIITHDGPMRRIAKDSPGYLEVIVC